MGTVEGDSGTNWKSQKAGGKITASTDRALAGPKHDAKGQYVASGCSCLFFVFVCSGMGAECGLWMLQVTVRVIVVVRISARIRRS